MTCLAYVSLIIDFTSLHDSTLFQSVGPHTQSGGKTEVGFYDNNNPVYVSVTKTTLVPNTDQCMRYDSI